MAQQSFQLSLNIRQEDEENDPPPDDREEGRPKWFEMSGGRLLVWEGVAAVRHLLTDDTWLVKLTDSGIRLLHIGVICRRTTTLASDGFWSCAEITAHLYRSSTPLMEIYYHSIRSDDALYLLRFISEHSGGAGFDSERRIDSVTVRFDPDPLRTATVDQVQSTIADWLRLRTTLKIHQFTMVLDDNMPM
uniref:Uncharacterized protein n=1 Tax=Plectus sambesii TaxID=2011161 RepID=A0A914WT60_9BILA